MTKEEKRELEAQIANLKQQLHEEEENWLAAARSNEAEYLGRYFIDEQSGVLYHPVCVLTPECPYQLWTIVIDTNSAYQYKHSLYRTGFGPENKHAYWLYYTPMYCTRIFHQRFKQLKELTADEFDIAAKAAFEQMWVQIHDSFTMENFKEKVTHYYNAASHLA